jgi:Ribosomal protein L7/L12 C-terminal domain
MIIAAVVGAVIGAFVVATMIRRKNAGRDSLMAYRRVEKDVPPRALEPRESIALLSPEQLAKLRAQIDRGHKIEAIKLVRDWTKMGLSEAKDLVESL